MMLRLRLAIAVWLVTVGGAEAQEAGSAQDGLKLAHAQCSECHLVDKVVGRSRDAAAPTFASIANVAGMTSAALTAALRTSHRTMPNVIIKSSDTGDLVAYILSLKDNP